jgi:hypothetical protein
MTKCSGLRLRKLPCCRLGGSADHDRSSPRAEGLIGDNNGFITERTMTKKRILISGGGSGFGELAAIGLAQAGHDTIVGAQIWPQVTQLRLKIEAIGLKNLRVES